MTDKEKWDQWDDYLRRDGLPDQQFEAICDAYTTLRAIGKTLGKVDDVIGNYCGQSAFLLEQAFPFLETLKEGVDQQKVEPL